jgi:hypothetical protein
MKSQSELYIDLSGQQWALGHLDAEERRLVKDLQRRVKAHPDWNDFDNYWLPRVAALYEGRGLSRREVTRAPVWQIAQDLSGRLAVSLGLAREGDYRDELQEIIRTRYKSRRAFCDATGISEDMLSHVLAGRKHLAIDTLTDALRRIGFCIRLLPNQPESALPVQSKSRAS